jgi:hypothetical protein
MVVFETDFSFKISLVCSSKWIHEITYSLFKKFWHAKTSATDARRYVVWGATFSKVPAHYPDPGNPGHYMNVFKTPTMLNDGQQQPVNNFAPRANLKCFFKDGAISSGANEVKEVAGRYFC